MISTDPFELPAELLAECAREPIHAPEAVQAFGRVLVLDAEGVVVRAANVPGALGCALADVWGEPGRAAWDRARELPPEGFAELGAHEPSDGAFELTVARTGTGFVAEAVPVADSAVAVAPNEAVVRVLGALAREVTTGADAPAFVEYLKQALGYEHVMVYRFDADWNGEVIAEAADGGARYRGLWFPASDVPPQARALYLRARVRVMADAVADPVPLLPAAREPADLSRCTARAVSPVHRAYARNMGVRGTLVASVVAGGKLWGLVACHAGAPRVPGAGARALIGAAAELLAGQVEAAERRAHETGTASASAALAAVAQLVTEGVPVGAALVHPRAALCAALEADGLLVARGGALEAVGAVPEGGARAALLDRCAARAAPVWATDARRELRLPDGPCGALAVRPHGLPDTVLIWLRGERVRTVEWGGDPRKGIVTGPGGARLEPRASFAAWREEVRGRARPWSASELALAAEFARSGVLAWLFEQEARRAATAALERALADRETLLRELHHRVKNNLAVVDDLLSLQTRRAPDPATREALGQNRARVRAMALVHELLYQQKQLGAVPVRAYAERLVGALADAYRDTVPGVAARVSAGALELDIDRAVPFGLIVTELVTNAYKHAFPNGRAGTIEVRAEPLARGWQLAVSDDGAGFAPGAALAGSKSLGGRLVAALAAQLGGTVAVTGPPGTTVTVAFENEPSGSAG
jgi:two-component system, chemotaxis family, sensor kinase Cph1